MKYRLSLFALMLGLLAPVGRADELIMKDGKEYSGKLVRADSNIVEFRVAGKIETFNTRDVAQIVFREPGLVNPPSARSVRTPTPAEPVAAPPSGNPPAERVLQSRPASDQPDTSRPTVTLPAGTPLLIRTSEEIDTDRNQVGDVFNAALAQPLKLGSEEIAPAGSEVKGHVAYAQESGTFAGRSELILELIELKVRHRTYQLRTSDYVEAGASRGRRTAATVGGAAAVGAVIGAIVGGGKGAAIGAGTGAAVGTGVQVLTRGQTLKVPAETLLEFKLQHPLTLEVP
ncbi:MAG: hypothetical protein HXY20_12215 [Acidobacteria bacterium]|nr:hypothetical protein [Acidobacteriota bacterium]